MAKRRFFVTPVNTMVTREVFPQNDKIKYIWEQERDQIFKRKKLNSRLIFINDPSRSITDFSFFESIELGGNSCVEIKLEVKVLCSAQWVSEWKAYFSTGAGKPFDFDNCRFEVQPEPDDKYRCIFNNWNHKYNVLDSSLFNQIYTRDINVTIGTGTCTAVNNQCLPGYAPCSGYATTQDMFDEGWCVQSHTVQIINDSSCSPPCGPFGNCVVVQTTWVRETITLPCVGGNCPVAPPGWLRISDSCGSGGFCTFARCPTNQVISPKLHGVFLNDITELMVDDLCNPLSFSSIFFDRSPDTTDSHYVAGINYVTSAANKVNHLMLSQVSDVVNPTATNPATVGEVTLKTVLDWYRVVFNCYWDIVTRADGNDYLVVEHFSYFSPVQTLDLTLPAYQRYVNHKNNYDHDREKIPEREKYQWQQVGAGRLDFVGKDIIYAQPCASVDTTTEHKADQLSTDILFLVNNTDAGNDGFVLIGLAAVGSDYFIDAEAGQITGQFQTNAHLSWANLHFNYHRHNRFLLAGEMNGNFIPFLSARPNVKQETLSIPACCITIDPKGTVKTELGNDIILANGFIQRMDLDLKTDMLTLTLEYYKT